VFNQYIDHYDALPVSSLASVIGPNLTGRLNQFRDIARRNIEVTRRNALLPRSIQEVVTNAEPSLIKKHAKMCSELKQFYVAVAKARIRLLNHRERRAAFHGRHGNTRTFS
jgi:hypothetical protein